MSQLLNIYGKYMVLKVFLDTDDNNLKSKYIDAANSHNSELVNNPTMIDAGFDLFNPEFYTAVSPLNKIDFKVICSATMVLDSGKIYNTGYYMYPRSSLSKTKLRLANSTGIIDAGYRGHLMGMFDLVGKDELYSVQQYLMGMFDLVGKDELYSVQQYDRLLQICAPGLVPIIVEVVNSVKELGEQTKRGDGGFGSTGR
jgi:dUTP pyrophosphatase